MYFTLMSQLSCFDLLKKNNGSAELNRLLWDIPEEMFGAMNILRRKEYMNNVLAEEIITNVCLTLYTRVLCSRIWFLIVFMLFNTRHFLSVIWICQVMPM